VGPDGNLPAAVLYYLTYVVGYAGLALALGGALALLARRTLDPDYREYTKKVDYVNLVFFVVTLAVALAAHRFVDPDFAQLRSYFASLVTFDFAGAAVVAWLTGLEIVLASVLLAYIPLTHMSHFFTKWFMYHDVRWSDEPNLRGGRLEQKVAEVLEYPVSWSASHIGGDGKKNWVDVATSDVEEKKE